QATCDREAVRLVSAALDGDEGAVQRVVEALAEDRATGPDQSPSLVDSPPAVDEPAHDIVERPLPWKGEDPEARARQALVPSPQLLVMVATTPAPSPITVTAAPEDTPGYSRAIACRPDASGRPTWMQATASTEQSGTQMALVTLGDEVWDW